MEVKKKVSKFLDFLILVSSLVIIVGLLYAGYSLITTIVPFIASAVSLHDGVYYGSMLIGVCGGIMFWLQLWIRAADKASKGLRSTDKKVVTK